MTGSIWVWCASHQPRYALVWPHVREIIQPGVRAQYYRYVLGNITGIGNVVKKVYWPILNECFTQLIYYGTVYKYVCVLVVFKPVRSFIDLKPHVGYKFWPKAQPTLYWQGRCKKGSHVKKNITWVESVRVLSALEEGSR